MALRWKLLRFQTSTVLLPATPTSPSPPSDSHALLSGLPSPQSPPPPTILQILSSLTLLSTTSHAAHETIALVLPAQVAVFRNISARSPTHFTLRAHDKTAAVFIHAAHALITTGLDAGVASVKIFLGAIPTRHTATLRAGAAPPTALAVAPGPRVETLAVGFADASVVILRGDLERGRSVSVRLAPAAGEMRALAGVAWLGFCGADVVVVAAESVACVREVAGGWVREALDARGVRDANGVTMFGAEVAVAREEGVYFYDGEGRGRCFAFPSEGGAVIQGVGGYLVHGAKGKGVVVYDLKTKVVAYRGGGEVVAVFGEEERSGAVMVMADGEVVRIEQVSLDSRVSTLLGRGMYSSAIQLAKAEDAGGPARPSPLLTAAVRQYAQFLMGKGDYDAAAAQLVGTIGGALEPSWVVTRLVEQPGLRSGLRSYLEALHHKGHASFVHTRVLITCYRHDRARAAILHDRAPPAEDRTTDDYIFKVLSDVEWSVAEVDSAIDICLDAGLYGVAERVARKRGRHLLLVRTLVENLGDVSGGLAVLRSLKCEPEAYEIASVCGRRFLASAPEEFVALVANLLSKAGGGDGGGSKGVSGFTAVKRGGKEGGGPATSDAASSLTHIATLFVDRPQWLASLLETVVSRSSAAESGEEAESVWMMLFEALTRVDVDRASASSGVVAATRAAPVGESALKVLQSRTAKIDLRNALEISERYGHGPCLEYIYEHLRMYRELAIHFRLSGDVPGMVRACRRHGKRDPFMWLEAISLLGPAASRAEQAGDESSVKPQKNGDNKGRPEGSQQGSTSPVSAHGSDLMGSLEEAMVALDSAGSLSAVEIVERVCAVCPEGKWKLIQSYFDRTVGRLVARAEEEEAASAVLVRESLEKRAEMERLSEAVVVKATHCNWCDDSLTFPSAHFFCGHSFHVACVVAAGGTDSSSVSSGHGHEPSSFKSSCDMTDSSPVDSGGSEAAASGEADCPLCAGEVESALSMRGAVEEKNERHDDFFRMLQGSKRDGGYETVMTFLARSPFITKRAPPKQ